MKNKTVFAVIWLGYDELDCQNRMIDRIFENYSDAEEYVKDQYYSEDYEILDCSYFYNQRN